MRKNWIIRVWGGFIGKVQVHLVANICGLSGLSLHVGVELWASSVQGVWSLWSLFTRRCGIVCKVWCRQLWENGSMVNYCECCEQTRADKNRREQSKSQTRADKSRQEQTRADKNRQESRAKVRHSEVSWLVYSVSTQGKSSTWCEEAGVDQTTIQ